MRGKIRNSEFENWIVALLRPAVAGLRRAPAAGDFEGDECAEGR